MAAEVDAEAKVAVGAARRAWDWSCSCSPRRVTEDSCGYDGQGSWVDALMARPVACSSRACGTTA